MRAIISAAAVILVASTAAGSAADMAVKASYNPPPQIWSWTGLYIGGHVGAGWGTTEANITSIAVTGVGGGVLPVNFPIAQNSRSGFLGGGQIGYNYQSGWTVFGVQADIAGMDLKGTTPCITVLSCTAKSDWLATVTGRVGAVVADKTLVYIKGGAAWMNTKHTLSVPAAGLGGIGGIGGIGAAGLTSSTEETAFGWVLGFGAEYALSTNWSAFIEYDYMDFQKKSGALDLTALAGGGAPGTATANVDFKNKVSVAKIGVNYKLDWGMPVVAKY
jgi:outer membrane immunogenic protein